MVKKIPLALGAVVLIGAGALLLYFFRLSVPRHIVNFATVLGLVLGIALIAAGFASRWLSKACARCGR